MAEMCPKKVKIQHFLPLVAKIGHLGISHKIKKFGPEAHISARPLFGQVQHRCVGRRPTHPCPSQGVGFLARSAKKF